MLADGGEEDDVPETVGRRIGGGDRKEEESGCPEEAGDEADEAEAADEEAEDAAKTETCSCGCHHHHAEGEAEDDEDYEDDEDDNIIIARIDTDENGEEVYVGPTDEEFTKVRAAYEALFTEEE